LISRLSVLSAYESPRSHLSFELAALVPNAETASDSCNCMHCNDKFCSIATKERKTSIALWLFVCLEVDDMPIVLVSHLPLSEKLKGGHTHGHLAIHVV